MQPFKIAFFVFFLPPPTKLSIIPLEGPPSCVWNNKPFFRKNTCKDSLHKMTFTPKIFVLSAGQGGYLFMFEPLCEPVGVRLWEQLSALELLGQREQARTPALHSPRQLVC